METRRQVCRAWVDSLVSLQWNLRIKGGAVTLSLYRGCSLLKNYNHNIGAEKGVHYWEIVPCSKGPLSEVPLQLSQYYICSSTLHSSSYINMNLDPCQREVSGGSQRSSDGSGGNSKLRPPQSGRERILSGESGEYMVHCAS